MILRELMIANAQRVLGLLCECISLAALELDGKQQGCYTGAGVTFSEHSQDLHWETLQATGAASV